MASAQADNLKSELGQNIEEFLGHLSVNRGCSPHTIRNYRHYLNKFSQWLEKNNTGLSLSSLNKENVNAFRLYLSRLSLGKRTQSYYAIALRSFLKWLIKNDKKTLAPEKIELPKVKDREIKFLSGEEVDRLLNSPTTSTLTGKRDKAILEVLFSTGLRVSELTKLNRDQIDFVRREFGVVGKGGRARVVFLSQRASEFLGKYLDARKDHFKPLFIRHKGKTDPTINDEKMRISPRSIQRMVRKYARKIKLPQEVTPHVLRHSFATDLLMAGADIRSVQEMLGHKNITTTQIYTHITNRQLRDIHAAFHGRGG